MTLPLVSNIIVYAKSQERSRRQKICHFLSLLREVRKKQIEYWKNTDLIRHSALNYHPHEFRTKIRKLILRGFSMRKLLAEVSRGSCAKAWGHYEKSIQQTGAMDGCLSHDAAREGCGEIARRIDRQPCHTATGHDLKANMIAWHNPRQKLRSPLIGVVTASRLSAFQGHESNRKNAPITPCGT